MKKLAPLAVLAAVAALALPAAIWADDGTPQQGSGARLARVQARIEKIGARIDLATQNIADLEQKLAEKCGASQPTAGDGQTSGPSRAERCARAQARLEKAQARLQRAKDRLAKVVQRIQQWQQNHDGSTVSASDQAALDQLQQQLADSNA